MLEIIWWMVVAITCTSLYLIIGKIAEPIYYFITLLMMNVVDLKWHDFQYSVEYHGNEYDFLSYLVWPVAILYALAGLSVAIFRFLCILFWKLCKIIAKAYIEGWEKIAKNIDPRYLN